VTSWNDHLNDVVDGLLAMALWAWGVRAWARHRARLAYRAARLREGLVQRERTVGHVQTFNGWLVIAAYEFAPRPLGHHRHEGVAPRRLRIGHRQ
jgi:hypothetical protein